MPRRDKDARAALVERWRGQEERLNAIVADLKAGRDWTRQLLRQEGRWEALPEVSSCVSKTSTKTAAPADLRGARLVGEALASTDGLANAALDYAVVDGCDLSSASLVGASLTAADVCGGSNLAGCRLENANLRLATVRDCDLSGAGLRWVDIRGAILSNVRVRDTDLRDLKIGRAAWHRWASTAFSVTRDSEMNVEQAPARVRRLIRSQQRYRDVRQNSRLLAAVLRALTGCGGAPHRLVLWVGGCAVAFAFWYAAVPLPGFLEGTWLGAGLTALKCEIDWGNSREGPVGAIIGPLLLSVTTLAGGEWGAIVPVNTAARIATTLELGVGVTFIGGYVALVVDALTRER